MHIARLKKPRFEEKTQFQEKTWFQVTFCRGGLGVKQCERAGIEVWFACTTRLKKPSFEEKTRFQDTFCLNGDLWQLTGGIARQKWVLRAIELETFGNSGSYEKTSSDLGSHIR